MRTLLLSQWYDPEPIEKIHVLAQGLAAHGHQVTVITGFPNYPGGRLYPGYRARRPRWEVRDGIRVLRLPLFANHSRSAGLRVLNYASFAFSAMVFGPVLGGPADVMWVYHPPLTVGLAAWWISRLRGIPFVFNVHDLWPETLAATGMVAPAWLGAVARLADFVYRQADAITVISPGFKRNLMDKGVPEAKLHLLPNWADEEIYHPVPINPDLARAHGLEDRFNIVYGGNVGAAQSLENVLEAAALLSDLPAVQFILIGDGIEAARLRQLAEARALRNVRFLPQQPAQAMPHFFASAGALLVHLKRDPLFEITIPSKIAAYLASQRPILGVVSGDAAEIIRSAQAGLICAPEDPPALAQAVRALVALPRAEREAMGAAGREVFERHYTRRALLERHRLLLEQVAGQNRRRTATKVANV